MERLTKRLSSGASDYNYPESCYFDDNSGPDKIAQSAFRQRCVERLADYEDSACEPEEVLPKDKADEIALKLMRLADLESLCNYTRLRELAEADKGGRLVVLPCKVGDIVWANLDGMRHPRKCEIEFVNIGSHAMTIVFSTVDGLSEQYGVNPSAFGKTVFLTCEKAKAALEAMKDGN